MTVLAASISVPTVAAPSPYVWRNVAIGGGGYVLDVYCHPRRRDLVYLRTDVGGFYRWDAAGKRWIPLTDGFRRDQSNFYGGEGLALDPGDPNVVYIAAGKYSGRGATSGAVFKSWDQGRTWTRLPLAVPMGGNEDHRWGGQRLAISPAHPRVLLFGSRRSGLWRSADAGASWERVNAFPTAALKEGIGITAVAFVPGRPGAVYAAGYGDGVYLSEDDGLTWRRTTGGPDRVERLAAAPGGALYATHAGGVARLGGGVWTDITPEASHGGFGGLALDPRDPSDLLVAAQKDRLGLYRSRDGGATWTRKRTRTDCSVPWYSGSMRQIQYAAGLTFDPCVPGRVWLTDWYATYATPDIDADPAILRSEERGHEELVAFTLAAPSVGLPLLSGVADVDGFGHTSLDTFPEHGFGDYYGGSGPAFGDTDQIAWCPAAPENVARVGVRRWDNTGGGALSRDGGRTWSAFPAWDAKILPGRIALSATDPRNMVVLPIGQGSAQVTRDGGHTWRSAAGLPGRIISGVWNWQFPLAGDGARPGVFYVAAGGKLYGSTDKGSTFSVRASGLPATCQALVTVPGRPGVIYLSAGDKGLYRSEDGGGTFRPLSTVRESALFAVGKSAPHSGTPTLYLYGTLADGETGIFRSTDGGTVWTRISDARVPVGDEPNTMAASFRTFGLIFIGTNGRGIYYGLPATEGAGSRE